MSRPIADREDRMLAYYINLIKQQESDQASDSERKSHTETIVHKETQCDMKDEKSSKKEMVAENCDNVVENPEVRKAEGKRPVGRPRKEIKIIEPIVVEERPTPRKSLAQIEADRIIATILVEQRRPNKEKGTESDDSRRRPSKEIGKEGKRFQSDEQVDDQQKRPRPYKRKEDPRRLQSDEKTDDDLTLPNQVQQKEYNRRDDDKAVNDERGSDDAGRNEKEIHFRKEDKKSRGPGRPPKKSVLPPRAVSVPVSPVQAVRPVRVEEPLLSRKTTHWGGLIETQSSEQVVTEFTFHPKMDQSWWKTPISLEVLEYEHELTEQLERLQLPRTSPSAMVIDKLDLRMYHQN